MNGVVSVSAAIAEPFLTRGEAHGNFESGCADRLIVRRLKEAFCTAGGVRRIAPRASRRRLSAAERVSALSTRAAAGKLGSSNAP